jgi:hypothetical protein
LAAIIGDLSLHGPYRRFSSWKRVAKSIVADIKMRFTQFARSGPFFGMRAHQALVLTVLSWATHLAASQGARVVKPHASRRCVANVTSHVTKYFAHTVTCSPSVHGRGGAVGTTADCTVCTRPERGIGSGARAYTRAGARDRHCADGLANSASCAV